MSMVCPQCKKSFQLALACPTCHARLQYQVHSLKVGDRMEHNGEGHWHNPWGRMIVGLILAQGLSFGLQQLLTAWLLASGEESSKQLWATLWGLAILHSVQGLSLLLGGALIGAGQHRGVLFGALLGLVNGLIFLLVQRQTGDVLHEIAIYGQPFLHVLFGGLGGLIGQQIWKPVPRIALPDDMAVSPTPVPRRSGGSRIFAGPVHLVRVLFGAILVVAGVISSNNILEFVVNSGQGKLTLSSHLQAQFVGWEITVLIIMAGAAIAGATTFNGLKQGLCVGIASSLIFIGVQLGNPKANFDAVLLMLISMVGFGLVGGWFGGQLFPPIVRTVKRRSILTG